MTAKTATAWMDNAACRKTPGFDELHPETFKPICATCPVRTECLEHGLAQLQPADRHTSTIPHGGLTAKELITENRTRASGKPHRVSPYTTHNGRPETRAEHRNRMISETEALITAGTPVSDIPSRLGYKDRHGLLKSLRVWGQTDLVRRLKDTP